MALSGQTDEAAALFKSARDERVRPAVTCMETLLPEPVAFWKEADLLIEAHRKMLRLAPLDVVENRPGAG